VQVVLDNFGTGYSSLGHLRKFRVDTLKIDRSLVRQITTASDEMGVLTAVIGMGRSLNLRIVAEGVDTVEQMRFLQAQKCDEGQVDYFGRPVPPEQFARVLGTGH
jgi:diguanylate cyclase